MVSFMNKIEPWDGKFPVKITVWSKEFLSKPKYMYTLAIVNDEDELFEERCLFVKHGWTQGMFLKHEHLERIEE